MGCKVLSVVSLDALPAACIAARFVGDRAWPCSAPPQAFNPFLFELEDIVWLTQQLALRRSGTRSMLIEVEIDAASRMLDGCRSGRSASVHRDRLLTSNLWWQALLSMASSTRTVVLGLAPADSISGSHRLLLPRF